MYKSDVAVDDITVVMSNTTTRNAEPQRTPKSLSETAGRMFGKPSTQYLNAMTIATSEAIADTGATSIFIMEGTDVKNKRPATKPLTINLPDGRQIKSTHICDIDIPGLPATLTGHIVPGLAVASLFGIRVLCKAGCKVLFDNEKCDVCYNGKLILRGYNDPSTDLVDSPHRNVPNKGVDHPRDHFKKAARTAESNFGPKYLSSPSEMRLRGPSRAAPSK